jgi:hypothetical protein
MRQVHRNYLRWLGASAPLWVQVLLVLTPVVPVLFACRAMARYVRECDEMERRIELESIALASLIVGMLFMCAGFLASAKIIALNGAMVAIWVFPSLCGCYGLIKCLAARRYQ